MADEHAPGSGSFSQSGIAAARAEHSAPDGARIGIAVARFNSRITASLYAGAVDVLLAAGVEPDHIRAVQVPGAVELPLALRSLAGADCAAVVALGCVIRGETSHFDYVCSAATDGCLRVMLDLGVPVGFGVITCDTLEQALRRSANSRESGGGHNVGADAAHAALEMLGVTRSLGN